MHVYMHTLHSCGCRVCMNPCAEVVVVDTVVQCAMQKSTYLVLDVYVDKPMLTVDWYVRLW